MTHQLLQFLGGYCTLVFRGKRSPQIVKAIYMAIVRVFVLLMTFQVDPCGLLNPQELRSQPAWVVEPREDDRLETLDLVQMLYNCRVQRNALGLRSRIELLKTAAETNCGNACNAVWVLA